MDLRTYRTKSAALYADIEVVLERHGFKLGRVSAGVEPAAGTVRLVLNLNDANLKAKDGSDTTPEAERYKKICDLFDLSPEWLGKSLPASQGMWFEVAGLKDTRGAKCVLLKRSDGRMFVTTPSDLIGRFARRRAA